MTWSRCSSTVTCEINCHCQSISSSTQLMPPAEPGCGEPGSTCSLSPPLHAMHTPLAPYWYAACLTQTNEKCYRAGDTKHLSHIHARSLSVEVSLSSTAIGYWGVVSVASGTWAEIEGEGCWVPEPLTCSISCVRSTESWPLQRVVQHQCHCNVEADQSVATDQLRCARLRPLHHYELCQPSLPFPGTRL